MLFFRWSWEEYSLNVLNAMGQTLTPMNYIGRIWEWERIKTVFSQKLQVLPSSMVKYNSEFVQMMKNCVFWPKRTQWVRNCVIRAARTINTKKLALNLWKYSIPWWKKVTWKNSNNLSILVLILLFFRTCGLKISKKLAIFG